VDLRHRHTDSCQIVEGILLEDQIGLDRRTTVTVVVKLSEMIKIYLSS